MLDKIKELGTNHTGKLFLGYFLGAILAVVMLMNSQPIWFAGIVFLVSGICGFVGKISRQGASRALGTLLAGTTLLAISVFGPLVGLIIAIVGFSLEFGLLKLKGE